MRPQRGRPGPSGGLEKEGAWEERKGAGTEREGVGGTSPGRDGPEKRRCSMKSRWKGESVNRRSYSLSTLKLKTSFTYCRPLRSS